MSFVVQTSGSHMVTSTSARFVVLPRSKVVHFVRLPPGGIGLAIVSRARPRQVHHIVELAQHLILPLTLIFLRSKREATKHFVFVAVLKRVGAMVVRPELSCRRPKHLGLVTLGKCVRAMVIRTQLGLRSPYRRRLVIDIEGVRSMVKDAEFVLASRHVSHGYFELMC